MKNPITTTLNFEDYKTSNFDAFAVYNANTDTVIKVFSKDRFVSKNSEIYMKRNSENDSGCIWSAKTGKKLFKKPSNFFNMNVRFYDPIEKEVVKADLDRIETYIKPVCIELADEDLYAYTEIDHEDYEYHTLDLIQDDIKVDYGQNVEISFYPDCFKVKYMIPDPFDIKFNVYNEHAINRAILDKKKQERKEKLRKEIEQLQNELEAIE